MQKKLTFRWLFANQAIINYFHFRDKKDRWKFVSVFKSKGKGEILLN